MNPIALPLPKLLLTCAIASALLMTEAGWAAPPPSQGLFPIASDYPAASFIDDLGFVEFPTARPEFRAPIATQITVNGVRMPSSAPSLFQDRLLAHLPHLQPIEVTVRPSGEIWKFPVGTMVAHEIRFTDGNHTLFEIRVVEKIDEKLWGFGTYTLQGDRLVLRRAPGSLIMDYPLVDTDGRPMNVRLKTIPQTACARCHSQTSIGAPPQDFAEETGPCEFHPANSALRKSWAGTFASQRGWAPFREVPGTLCRSAAPGTAGHCP